jgi:predicted RNA-binding Zn ribbon-like protein
MDVLLVTGSAEKHWLNLDRGLAIPAAARVHFPASLRAYGPLVGHDLADPRGLLGYAIRFVNGKEWNPDEQRPIGRPLGRERLRELLDAAIRRPGEFAEPSDQFLEELRQKMAAITWFARLERTTGGASICHHAMLHDANHFYAVVAVVLLDSAARDALGQCQYEPCGEFFLVESRSQHEGRPQRRYCGPQHAEDAHAAAAAARQLQVRARKRLEKRFGREVSRRAVRLAYEHNPEVITMAEQLADRARVLVPTIKHFAEILEGAVPKGADIAQRERSGDLCLFVDWRLGTDPTRPNKRSKSVLVRITRDAISDYSNSDERRRKSADHRLRTYLEDHVAAFDPEHDTPRHIPPPREEWVIGTHDINV